MLQITGILKRGYEKQRKTVPTLSDKVLFAGSLNDRTHRRHLHPQDMGMGRSRIPFTDPSPPLLHDTSRTLYGTS